MIEHGLFDKRCFIIEHGRHTYWTNKYVDFRGIDQTSEFLPTLKKIGHKQFLNEKTGKIYRSNCTIRVTPDPQGGDNVKKVIDYWLFMVSGGFPL